MYRKWILHLTGLAIFAGAVAYLSDRPKPPAHQLWSGFEWNGRHAIYSVADGCVEYVVVFDHNWASEAYTQTGGSQGYGFSLHDGRQFTLTYDRPKGFVIDGTKYALDAGRVFFVTVTPGGNQCQQRAINLEPCPNDTNMAAITIQADLKRAAEDAAAVVNFLRPIND